MRAPNSTDIANQRILHIFRALVNDFRDASAARAEVMHRDDLWAVLAAGVAAVGATTSTIKEFAAETVGLSPEVATTIVLVVLIAWAVRVVTAKTVTSSLVTAGYEPVESLRYRYTHSLRVSAKLAFVVLIFVTGTSTIAAWLATRPLPKRFYGFVLQARTGEPVVDARVTVSDESGADVTSGDWLTDSRGFYIIELSHAVSRSAKLLVFSTDCPSHYSLSLSRSFETTPTRDQVRSGLSTLRPLFRHYVHCEARDDN